MLKSGEFSRLISFITSMMFSAAVIFMCSFGIVGVFQALSTYNLDDMSAMANQDADSIVATIIGISIDEQSMEGKIVDEVSGIINGFENKEDYSFADATNDAKKVFSHVFDDFSTESITTGFENIMHSVENLITK